MMICCHMTVRSRDPDKEISIEAIDYLYIMA